MRASKEATDKGVMAASPCLLLMRERLRPGGWCSLLLRLFHTGVDLSMKLTATNAAVVAGSRRSHDAGFFFLRLQFIIKRRMNECDPD